MKSKEEDIQEIRKLAEDWRSGWIEGDVEFLLSLYSENPALLPQSQPAVVGKESIRPLYQAVIEQFKFDSTAELVKVDVSGDIGYFWVAYTLTATPKAGGESIKEIGKTIYIVKRQPNDKWKIEILIDNNDQTSIV